MLKVYLDTNLFRQFFFRVYDTVGKGLPFKEPELFKFFRMNQNKIELFTSCLSKAEIFRQLRSDLNLKPKDIEEFWKVFRTLISMREIKEFRVTEEIAEIVKEQSFKKKTITNILHFIIAKETALIFVTGDKEIVRKVKKFYRNVYLYPEFREKFETDSF